MAGAWTRLFWRRHCLLGPCWTTSCSGRAAESLDPVPVSVSRLLSIISKDHWAFAEVEEVIQRDQALTGRLLQVANRLRSATLIPIGTIRDAVVRVGIGPVVSFAIASCLGPSLRRALPEYGLSEGICGRTRWWPCSGPRSSRRSSATVPPETVTAALLHDVGKLVLARFLSPELLAGIAEARANGERSEIQAEVEVLGVHHGELGGIIARHWSLPDCLADAITYHHAPDKVSDVVCDAVHVANIAARLIDVPPGAAANTASPALTALDRLGLSG